MAKIGSFKLYVGVAVFLVIFLPPFAKYQELRYKNQKLKEQITALELTNKDLEEKKHRLETDITYVEKKAREKIGVIRKGEIVMRDASQATSQQQQP